MKIFLIILLCLMLIIAAILMLPVDIIIKSDKKGGLQLRFRLFFKVFGEKSNPNSAITKAFKKTIGIEKLEAEVIKKKIKEKSYIPTVVETITILKGLLSELGHILKHIKAKRFYIDVKCAADDAADAAINYGQYCALIYPLTAGLASIIKIPKRAMKISVSLAPELSDDKIDYEIIIRIRVIRLIAAFFKIAFKEAMRNLEDDKPQKNKK